MAVVEHARFGRLDTGAVDGAEVIWQGTGELAGEEVEALLWAGAAGEPSVEELDLLAARLDGLPAADAAARAALRAHLEEDRYFIDFHVDELDGIEAVERLVREAAGAEVGPAAFVAALRLNGVGLWLNGLSAGTPVVLDYVLAPEFSDQILAVRMTGDGAVDSVDWES
ncbi:DUF2004 domain-containing protein [Kitasatospora cheerisanensis]|uniref:DUF2004 domain-containing protein n=1 Tax=Kitasatospora cheerisanensis KCTC 2395 TaxID=1348663 RepID=A0A066YM27_9ACTN|nr:DUF2004 domain-containing protein [Kitasatospora cheerisanensis]KDN82172.1 hypothetical protein KCH_60700 [Kitasatospora cheerisanensis KCTC 2395]